MVARAWGRERGSYCFMGTEFQFCKVKGVLDMGAGDSCIAT